MDDTTRRKVEDRAYTMWEEAGRPEGSALLYWLRAERELGVIDTVEPGDPFVTLHEFAGATEGSSPAEQARMRDTLQQAVEEAVPPSERLPDATNENPVTEHVEEVATGRAARPEGGTSRKGSQGKVGKARRGCLGGRLRLRS